MSSFFEGEEAETPVEGWSEATGDDGGPKGKGGAGDGGGDDDGGDDDDDDEGGLGLDCLSALMSEPDAEQWFDFTFEDLQREARLELRMRGSRRDFGRTLACTVETLWRAAEVWVWM